MVESFVRVLAIILAFIVSAIGIVSSISALSGGPPLWPAALVIEPGTSDQSQPFDVPFTVSNPSVLFAATDIQFACALVGTVLENSGNVEKSIVIGVGQTALKPGNPCSLRPRFPPKPAGRTRAQSRAEAPHN